MKTIILHKQLPISAKAYDICANARANGYMDLASITYRRLTTADIEFMQSDECKGIIYYSGSDDTQFKVLNVTERNKYHSLRRSCDTARGFAFYDENKFDLAHPYFLYDTFSFNPETVKLVTVGSGYVSGRKSFLTELHIND